MTREPRKLVAMPAVRTGPSPARSAQNASSHEHPTRPSETCARLQPKPSFKRPDAGTCAFLHPRSERPLTSSTAQPSRQKGPGCRRQHACTCRMPEAARAARSCTPSLDSRLSRGPIDQIGAFLHPKPNPDPGGRPPQPTPRTWQGPPSRDILAPIRFIGREPQTRHATVIAGPYSPQAIAIPCTPNPTHGPKGGLIAPFCTPDNPGQLSCPETKVRP